MNGITLGLFAYILAQLLIGLLVSRRVSTESDYLLAAQGAVLCRALVARRLHGTRGLVPATLLPRGLNALPSC